jgi:hypothetical protein
MVAAGIMTPAAAKSVLAAAYPGSEPQPPAAQTATCATAALADTATAFLPMVTCATASSEILPATAVTSATSSPATCDTAAPDKLPSFRFHQIIEKVFAKNAPIKVSYT